MTHRPLQSHHANLPPVWREPDRDKIREDARRAWHEHGTIILRAEWLPSWADRKQAELLAEKLFGPRKAA